MTTLEMAAQMRAGEIEFSPFALWESAKKDGADYKEAMIHAGGVGPANQTGTFAPYTVCPDCGVELGPYVPHLPDFPPVTLEDRRAMAAQFRRMADELEAEE